MTSDHEAIVANLIDKALTTLPARIADAGLPADAVDAITADTAVALAGARRAVLEWSPRPPLTTDAEVDALYDVLDSLIDARVADILIAWQGQFATSRGRTATTLREWDTGRRERSEPTEAAIRKQMRVRVDGSVYTPVDAQHFERQEHEDGTFSIRYPVIPSRDD